MKYKTLFIYSLIFIFNYTSIFINNIYSNQTTFTDEIKEHFFLAHELFQNKDFKAALIEYDNICQIDPAYVDSYFYKAQCYYMLQDYILALYYLAITLYLDPKNSEANNLFLKIKENMPKAEIKKDGIICQLDNRNLEKLIYDLYGSSLYLKQIIELNNNNNNFKPNDEIFLPLDLSQLEGIKVVKKFDGSTLQHDLEIVKETILLQKEAHINSNDAKAFLDISEEYLKINRLEHAIKAYEKACFIDNQFILNPNFELIDKVYKKLNENPNVKDPIKYFYLGFIEYVKKNYREALSNFSYATTLGLNAELMNKAFKYSMLSRQNLKLLEAKAIEKESILKANAIASISKDMAEVIQNTNSDEEIKQKLKSNSNDNNQSDLKTNNETEIDFNTMTKEQKAYYCYQQRKAIDEAVQKYNENNIIEMVEETFSIEKLKSTGYLKIDPKCPDNGTFTMNHNGYIQCSIHGL